MDRIARIEKILPTGILAGESVLHMRVLQEQNIARVLPRLLIPDKYIILYFESLSTKMTIKSVFLLFSKMGQHGKVKVE